MGVSFSPAGEEQEVRLDLAGVQVDGTLGVPPEPQGLVLFAHGSGSSRMSPRNRFVAQVLRNHGIATLLFDLLTRWEEQEEQFTGHLRFNIRLLADRLEAATQWVRKQPEMAEWPLGYFGASTGGGAALVAAAERSDVAAVVSRGGRPDMAADALPRVKAPTLLIVGGEDTAVIRLNEQALSRLTCTKTLRIVPEATHLFEEPGALEEVAQLAAEWFQRFLSPARAPSSSEP